MLHITDASARHSTQLSDLNSNTHQPSMQNNNSIKSFTAPSSSTLANSPAPLKPNVSDGNSGSIYSMAEMLGSELYDQSIYSKPTQYISNYSPHDNVTSPAFHSGYHREITANGGQTTPNALYSQPHLAYTYFSPPHPHGVSDSQPNEVMMSKDKERSNSVNAAFSTLRMLIPTDPCDRKLSKIETLRLAKSYISHLHTVLTAGWEDDQPCLNRYADLCCFNLIIGSIY